MAVRRKRKAAPKRRKARPLSASVKKTLTAKAKKTRFTYGQLARVYRRGYYGQDNKRPRLRGMCELTTKDKFYETISSKISEKQSDNVF